MTDKVHEVSPSSPKPRAPKPPTMLSGTGGYTPPSPERTQVPPGHPDYYPNDLKVETDAIVSSAIVKFTEQKQASQLCQYVTSEMTAPFCAAVSTQKIKAHEVKGHVERLIRWLLVYNCDYSRDGYMLENEIRNSAEWLKLLQEVACSAKGLESGHALQEPKTDSGTTLNRPPVGTRQDSVIENSVETSSPVLTAEAVDIDNFPGLGWGHAIPPTAPVKGLGPSDSVPPRIGGRPRKDEKRRRVIALSAEGKTWPQIASIISEEAGEKVTADACRKLANTDKTRTKPGQN